MQHRSSRRALLGGALLAIGAVLALGGCAQGKPDVVPSDEDVKAVVTVRVTDNVYEPAEVQITPDQAVRWEFLGPAEHDVVAADGSFVSELVTEGTYTHRFTEEGDYEYDCSIHPEMRGVVHVVAP
ncbi:cupredoxin domain-containing protein [Leucobacter ruminantium]|uniref:cupredoxin domain-containing protein n=1 Tax=Leucobacter ruminantium TaxID=1289170 RepID=UPI003132C818